MKPQLKNITTTYLSVATAASHSLFYIHVSENFNYDIDIENRML